MLRTHFVLSAVWLIALGPILLLPAEPDARNRLREADRKLNDPASAMIPDGRHPLQAKIDAFLQRQAALESFDATGLTREDYLRVIDGQVKVMRTYQDAEGRIIDPVEKIEKFYTTPCYAHSVAVLAAAGYNADSGLLESGMQALDVSLADMATGTSAGGHGDFYTWPAMFAWELFGDFAPPRRRAGWKEHLAAIQPEKLYRALDGDNWNVVNLSGEYLRAASGLTGRQYIESCLGRQLSHFTSLGMYSEQGNPLPYDLFPRHYLAGVLHKGYRGELYATYRDLLGRGAWTSLFMQSPTGQLPTGYRSSHHLWNEAQQAVMFEIYASHYAKEGRLAEAGAFKRAARLSLASIKRWIRPDGSGYIVKNRYPIESRHGYESYSAHTCYNMLACSMLAQAWQFAEETIAERPAPADVGGFVVAILDPFHKVFANAGGTYVEYDTGGDHIYNPTGLIRVHLKGGHPQLGPSDGCAPKYSGQGVNFAVGPEWQDAVGWHRLAGLSPPAPNVEVLEETPQRTRFRITYQSKPGGHAELPQVSTWKLAETITVEPQAVTVEDEITSPDVKTMRVNYPMLVFDGLTKTDVELAGNSVSLSMDGRGVRVTMLEPANAVWVRSGQTVGHRNGLAELASADVPGRHAVYRIEPK